MTSVSKFKWFLIGVILTAVVCDWVRLRFEMTSVRGQTVRSAELASIRSKMVDSCLSSLALCVNRDEDREVLFRDYLQADSRIQEREDKR